MDMDWRIEDTDLGVLPLHCDLGYIVTEYDLGWPEVRAVSYDRPLADGAFDLTRYFGQRSVTLSITLNGEARDVPEAALRTDLAKYLHPRRRPVLSFIEQGTYRRKRMVVRGSEMRMAMADLHRNKMIVNMVCSTPYIESYEVESAMISVSPASGARTTVVANDGDVDADWQVVISGVALGSGDVFGLADDPLGAGLELRLADRRLAFRLDLLATQQLVVDSASKSATIVDDSGLTQSAYQFLSPDSEWWKIPPGLSEFSFFLLDDNGDVMDAPVNAKTAEWTPSGTPPLADHYATWSPQYPAVDGPNIIPTIDDAEFVDSVGFWVADTSSSIERRDAPVQTGAPPAPQGVLRVLRTATTGPAGAVTTGSPTSSMIQLEPGTGREFQWSANIRREGGSNFSVDLAFDFFDADGGYLSSPGGWGIPITNTWNRIRTGWVLAPDGAVFAKLWVRSSTALAVGVGFDFGQVMVADRRWRHPAYADTELFSEAGTTYAGYDFYESPESTWEPPFDTVWALPHEPQVLPRFEWSGTEWVQQAGYQAFNMLRPPTPDDGLEGDLWWDHLNQDLYEKGATWEAVVLTPMVYVADVPTDGATVGEERVDLRNLSDPNDEGQSAVAEMLWRHQWVD